MTELCTAAVQGGRTKAERNMALEDSADVFPYKCSIIITTACVAAHRSHARLTVDYCDALWHQTGVAL